MYKVMYKIRRNLGHSGTSLWNDLFLRWCIKIAQIDKETEKDSQLSKDINRLEYRPDFTSEREEIRSGYVPSIEDDFDLETKIPEKEKEVGDGVLTDNITNLVVIEGKVLDLIDKLKEDLKDFTIEVEGSDYFDDLSLSKKELGLDDNGSISILDYEEALENVDVPAGAFIVEIFEESVEDIHGSLKAELFGDLLEISKEIDHTFNYIDSLVGKSLLGEAIDYSDEDWQEQLLEAEKRQKKYRESVQKEQREAEEDYKHAMLFDQDALIPAKQRKLDNYRFKKDTTYQTNSLKDVNKTLRLKNNELGYLTNEIEDNLERKAIKDEGSIWTSITDMTKDEKDAKTALTNARVMLKFSVDSKNNQKHMMKNRLRNLYSTKQREKILNELDSSNEAFQEGVTDIESRLVHLEKEQDESLETLLDGVADGLAFFSKERNDKMKEFYNISLAESGLREEKLDNIFNKDNSRQSYQLSEKLEKMVEQRLAMQS